MAEYKPPIVRPIIYDSVSRIVTPGRKPCRGCGGPAVAVMTASSSGWTGGSGYNHLPTCAELRCPHGVQTHSQLEEPIAGCSVCDDEPGPPE